MHKSRSAPQLSTDDLRTLESAIPKSEPDDGITRRVALAMLSRSGADRAHAIATDVEFAETALVSEAAFVDYASRLRSLAGLIESAADHLRAAVCNGAGTRH